ncbi:C40 family peptidase [Eubacterium limosum]|uniref:C40 family peptidase n=1 Tax=Eubacterium limosum TaxID=1736 RepID=UPI001062AA31|nr:C40 family peptidase [Eubacterium limosum]
MAPASGQNVQKWSRSKLRQESKQARPSERLREKPGGADRAAPVAGEAPGSLEGESPVSSGPATSGQNVQKSRPSDRLREKPGGPARGESAPGKGKTADGPGKAAGPGPDKGGPDPGAGAPPGGSAPGEGAEKLGKAKRRMEQRGVKLDQAREKLAAQKPPKKPGAVRRVGRVVKNEAWMFVHGKIYQVEDENVGIEAAHRSELVGEAAVRGVTRFVKKRIRTHPARAVRKAEAKNIKATADYHFRAAALEHPELRDNMAARAWKKHQFRKQYKKRAREAAKQSAKAAGKTAAKGGRAVGGFIKRHPVGCLIALAVLLIVFMFQSCASSLVTLGNGMVGSVQVSTYPCEDAELLGAEAAYADGEAELQNYLDTYERTHDYDEYHFDLDEIEHDPYNLLSILCSLHEGGWTVAEIQGTLQTLFDRQYILTERVVVETHYDSDDEPYDWYVCYVTLENTDLSRLPVEIMDGDQLSRYALYMAMLGNRPDLFPGSGYVDRYLNPPPVYDIPPEALEDETFAAMMEEAQKYVGYPYVWGGSSPATSFDCSGFVSWVINHSGWNVGRLGAQGLYNICAPVREPRPGDLVFFVGTYDTPGVSHCGIYVGGGVMLHSGDPIQYSNLNSNYWQTHFFAYGRLP